MHQSRIARMDYMKDKHERIVLWYNDLLYDIKIMLDANHPPLIVPSRQCLWEYYREQLLNCNIELFKEHNKHAYAVSKIDVLMKYLNKIWNKEDVQENVQAIKRLLPELDRHLHEQLSCYESMVKY